MFTHSCTIFFSVSPDIVTDDSSTDVAVQEGEDTLLTCKTTGNVRKSKYFIVLIQQLYELIKISRIQPTPRVTWKREDGDAILIKKPGSREIQRGKQKRKSQKLFFFIALMLV